MSAGSFVFTKYESSYSTDFLIHPIKVQPETIAADIGGEINDPPVDVVNNPIVASVSGSRRSNGLIARRIRIKLNADQTPPTGYSAQSVTSIPVLTTRAFATATKGATVIYLGVNWTIVGRVGESPE